MRALRRLLIGIAWPLIVVLYWLRSRHKELKLPPTRAVELVFLTLATVYSFVIPFKGTISLVDTVVFIGIFVAYMWRIAPAEAVNQSLLSGNGAMTIELMVDGSPFASFVSLDPLEVRTPAGPLNREQRAVRGELLFGRVTYEMMAAFWPTPQAAQMLPKVAEGMNAMPKTVFSRTIDAVTWQNTTLVKGDPVNEVKRLKQQPGPDIVILGSGSLVDLPQWGLPKEPTVGETLAAGADLVAFSGDKLLGGPQAGIIAGRADLVEKLKKHPLARALRLDKMTLAALEATLRLYLDPDRAVREVPVLRMLTEPADEVRLRAGRMACGVADALGDAASVDVREDVSRAGGGALPMADVPTFVLTLQPRELSVVELESRLRLGEPHVIARIAEDRLLIDPRTLTEAEELEVTAAVARAVLGA